MRHWIVFFARVHEPGERFVCGELGGGERDGHSQGRRVGDVEGGDAFVFKDSAEAGEYRGMR